MRLSSLGHLALVGTATGCAGNVTGAAGDAEAGTTTSAVVVVERTTDTAQVSRAEGSARFLRVTGPTSIADALRVVGAALELPPRGTCAAVPALAPRPAPGEGTPVVELVDVGPVSLRAEAAEMRLLPRQLPDVTDVVSGVVYDRAAEAASLPAATPYLVRVAGGPAMAPFDVAAVAPSDPANIHVSGDDGSGTVIASGLAVDLSWTAGGSDDVVYVDVRPNGVRCVFADAGHGALSTLFFDDAGTLVVHRLHRETLRAQGFDSGEIRFDFARMLAYVRR